MNATPFDRFSENYEKVHTDALPPMVESRQFLEQKVEWVRDFIATHYGVTSPAGVLDFGCSVGRVLLALRDEPGVGSMVGVDESGESIRLAASQFQGFGKSARFVTAVEALPADFGSDLILAFNVLHHVEPAQRTAQLATLASRLNPGGYLLVWEHNPWNPATRYLVRICPFDEGVILLHRTEAEKLLSSVGLVKISSEYVNISPPTFQKFAPIRWMESATRGLPIGAQYRMVFQKPTAVPRS